MYLVEDDPPERSSPSAAFLSTAQPSGHAAQDAEVPTLEELFSDPAVRRRVGELISKAAWRASIAKW